MFRILAVLSLAAALGPAPLTAQSVRHPLDPLTWGEHWTLLETLRAEGRLDGETRFSLITLQEPSKDLVWSWTPGAAVPRAGFAVVRQGPRTFEAVVDLSARRTLSWTERPGVQPNWLGMEFEAMVDEVKKHPDFIAALARRGIDDLTFIDCVGLPPGYFATPEQRGRRVAHVFCRDARQVRNTYTRAIENVTIVFDMEERKVLRVVDEGVVPVPTTSADYDRSAIGPPREIPGPIQTSQPLGPGFQLDGHRVAWQRWSFHVRPDIRLGMILSAVRYRDGDHDRPVLYQGSLSEIFVPYMDPSYAWYARNFLDAGEFPIGGLGKPLLPGRDCPDHAVYLDAVFAGDNGRPQQRPAIICLFERAAGDISWRHFSDQPESRARRDLVVRMAAVLGNYDYLFDWVFQQDGTIRVGVGATGIVEVKMVGESNALAAGSNGNGTSGNGRPDAYGRFVAPNVVAVNHDHYFSFRLDLDVDGAGNRFMVDRLKTVTLPADHPRRSLWVAEESSPATEREGMLDIDWSRPAMWRVASLGRTNALGYPTSYQLMPGTNARILLTPDDYPRRRAGFTEHHLWVTPYAPGERYAAGDYPTLSEPGEGLPKWTAANRSIRDRDVVLWYTVGMHHMARAEDWPVMPVMWHSFELRPFDFFDRNPALDLP